GAEENGTGESPLPRGHSNNPTEDSRLVGWVEFSRLTDERLIPNDGEIMPMRVVIAADNASQHEPIRQVVLGMGMECTPSDCVSAADLPVRLSHGAVNMLLVHVGDDVHGSIDVIKSALPLTPAPLLAIGAKREADDVLKLIQGGAREYLDEGALQPGLEKAMDKLQLTALARLGHGNVVG